MLEEWIYLGIKHDKSKSHCDGRIEKEIALEKIISIHEEFKKMDDWLSIDGTKNGR